MFKRILQFSLFAALVVAKNSSEESGEEMEKSDGLCMGPEEVGTEIFFTLFNEIFLHFLMKYFSHFLMKYFHSGGLLVHSGNPAGREADGRHDDLLRL